MAVPFKTLVIYIVVCLYPGPSWLQYAMLKKKDLQISVFDQSAFKDVCEDKLRKDAPNYFRYIQPFSDYLYVGAMNCLVRFHLSNLTYENSVYFPVDDDDLWRCEIQGKRKVPECQNHIRAVMPDVNDNTKLFVCGTGGYAPRKYSLENTVLNMTGSPDDGTKYCPFDPFDNITSLYVEDGNLDNKAAHYFSLYGDFIKHLPVIFRPSFNLTKYADLVSAKGDVTWLNSPQFVGSFNVDDEQHGNQVFFFFREIAEEYPASKSKTYSRVAKVCKQDHGGGSIERNQKKWLSYQKARLVCSLPASDPYYWDDIYDVYETEDKFYAVFFKQGGDHNSSAICVFTKTEIFKVFDGRFKYQVNKTWETLPRDKEPNPRLDNCKIHDTNHTVFEGAQTVSRHQLMDQWVFDLYEKPIFSKTGVQFLKIVVADDDKDSGKNIYVATATGDIYNLFLYDCNGGDFRLEEVAILSPLEHPRPIWNMKLMNKTILYIGTDYEVAQVNLAVCTQYKKRESCIFDVHCMWCDRSCRPRDYSCSGNNITYRNIYQKTDVQCQDFNITQVLEVEVNGIKIQPIEGLYITLDVNYDLQRAGATVWKQNDTEISFDETGRFFLSNEGTLIIKNVTMNDNGHFMAFDTVYRERRRVADYFVKVNPGDTNEELVEAWKQAFVDWSASYSNWKKCSKEFLLECTSG